MKRHLASAFLAGCLALGSGAAQAAHAASDETNLDAEVHAMDESNMDSAFHWAKQDADKTVGLIAGLMVSCHNDLQAQALYLPYGSGDDTQNLGDSPADQLSFEADMVDQKAEAYRKQAALVPIALPKTDPEELAIQRAGYRTQDREQDLKRAEGDLSRALKRLRQKQVFLDFNASQMISILKSYLTEYRQGYAAAATLAGKTPSSDRKEQLKAMEKDISDLARETRLLEIYLTLEKINALLFHSGRT